MSKIRSKLEAIRAPEGNNEEKEDGSVRAEESVALNRVSGEDLDEKVTTKSRPGKEEE